MWMLQRGKRCGLDEECQADRADWWKPPTLFPVREEYECRGTMLIGLVTFHRAFDITPNWEKGELGGV